MQRCEPTAWSQWHESAVISPAQVLADPTSFDVAVTTYEMVTSAHFGAALSHTITWRLLVLDEGHKIKNEETRVANAMRHVACARCSNNPYM